MSIPLPSVNEEATPIAVHEPEPVTAFAPVSDAVSTPRTLIDRYKFVQSTADLPDSNRELRAISE